MVSGTSVALFRGETYCIGSSGGPPGIWKFDVVEGKATEVLKSVPKNDEMVVKYQPLFSKPRHVEFMGTMGTVHAYLYKPWGSGSDQDATPPKELPPLLVKCHGGPTARTSSTFRPDIQYWCSRGFSVLDVDYSGSTGYGKEYRNRLRGRWGKQDTEDVIEGAKFVAREGWCDERRVCIDGGR